MKKRFTTNLKLGTFVLGGLMFLVVLLYMIGKNGHLFGATYTLKARFTDAQGLVEGNNVRFSGINVGTVKDIAIMPDAVIEVTMVIDEKMLHVIRKNAQVSIGTEGLVGNKVIDITPAKEPAEMAVAGNILATRKAIVTDDILETLYQTNNDVSIIAAELKTTVVRINNSALWSMMDDKSIPDNLKASVANVYDATHNTADLTNNLNSIISRVKDGEGSIGKLLNDTSFASDIKETILKAKSTCEAADSLANNLNRMAGTIHEKITEGNGIVPALLNDSTMLIKLNASLDNIQKGTNGFNQNMEALKHNFLFRRYFRKQNQKE